MQTYILSITFVFGILRLISFTKIFKLNLIGFLEAIFTDMHSAKRIIYYLDYLIFYFSLVYQSWYWLFNK